MKPYADNVVTFRVLLAGYEGAAKRYTQARTSQDPGHVFLPLFEALNWCVALDDHAAEHWAPTGKVLGFKWREYVPDAEVVAAVRCVRNRVHHQWADALELTHGFASPLTTPVVAHEWRWRTLTDLPQATAGRASKATEAIYERRLAHQPARQVLRELIGPFTHLAEMLEPPLPTP